MKRATSAAWTAAWIVSKGLELLHWIGAATALASLVLSLAAGDWLSALLARGVPELGTTLTTYGFEVTPVLADGTVSPAVLALFSVGAAIILSLMAMVFRNLYLIFRTAKGKTRFAKGSTPFQGDITRMVREIGIFYLSVPAVGLVMSTICRLARGTEAAEICVNVEGFVTGLLLLCLSQVFAYGARLQRDVDGLL